MAKRSRSFRKHSGRKALGRMASARQASPARRRWSELYGRRVVAWGWLIFAVALIMRCLFWQATADAPWSYSAHYKGDAPLWVDYARAIQQDLPFELGLPLRPPGNGYLLAAVWDGQDQHLGRLKLLWSVLGAATAGLFYAAVRRGFGVFVGCVVGFGIAVGQGFMVLSTSLNNETPYLFVVAALFYGWSFLFAEVSPWRLAIWGGLNALACLLRVEHALFFVLCSMVLAWRWGREGASWQGRRVLRVTAWVAVPFIVLLVPWHLQAWQACRGFNHTEPQVGAATEQAYRQVEQALAGMTWHPDAEAERRRLPAATRRAMGNFVAATVFVRGGREVRAADFAVLDEAFGARPRPLSEYPFVALYGGLNFYLANHADAPPGFDRGPLNAPPPLDGGIGRYPSPLVAGLPPPNLALTYPPHLDIVNRGYGKGLSWIIDHPADFAAHVLAKGHVVWDGATLGLGGYNLPLGSSGVRRKVDVLVPHRTAGVMAWQWFWLAVMAVGLGCLGRRCWGRRGLGGQSAGQGAAELWPSPLGAWAVAPWLAWGITKWVVTVAFFGYARQGITLAPLVWLLLALALVDLSNARWLKRVSLSGLGLVGCLVLLELLRCLQPPVLLLDGRAVGSEDPWPSEIHETRRVQVADPASPKP